MKRFYASLAALTVAIAGFLLLNVVNGTSNAALPRDCDNNSIIFCGGITPSELASRYTANKTGDLATVYHSYGLSDHEMTHAGTSAKMGEIHRDGRVTVNGEVVATGATSIGREQLYANRTKVKIGSRYYYEGSPEYSYAKGVESIVAYVFFDQNGNFKAAVMTSCGNPVHAHPKPKPEYACNALTADKISRTERKFAASASAKNGAAVASYTYDFGDGTKQTSNAATVNHTYSKPGTYTAKLTANINVDGQTKAITGANCQTTFTIETPPPTPVYTCDSLTPNKISRTEYAFTGKATAEGGAQVVGYNFDFGDGSSQTVANPNNVAHTYTTNGDKTITMTVTFMVNGETKTVGDIEKCVAHITVVPENMVQVCNPATGQTITVNESDQGKYKPVGDIACQPTTPTPPELPHTGPADFIGGAVGLGSLIASIGYYVASRRGLLAQLLGR
ncbi:MAG TPA: PKD domain-containing protein [Candidatus Chromulinivoraceae bacterium]|nr:PKD domain-containing protein [Candidatus Chromulinivoraceae bacterium]